MLLTRRRLIALGGAAATFAAAVASAESTDAIAAMEARLGGRIGVAALDTGGGARLSHRADERFAMCSTFKWLLAAAILADVDRKLLTLEQPIPYGEHDLLPTSPVTKARVAVGAMPLEALCEAAVEVSDNGAANLLLRRLGGPAAYTRFLRRIGDSVTRLDRMELALNSNLPNDPRDTTTPRAMVATMQKVLLGQVLSPDSRERLVGWMKDCKTGLARLRHGLPADWIVGDKTGTGDNGAVNDLAIAWPPQRAPILIAAYLSGSTAPLEILESVHAEIGRIVAAAFA